MAELQAALQVSVVAGSWPACLHTQAIRRYLACRWGLGVCRSTLKRFSGFCSAACVTPPMFLATLVFTS